MAPVGGYRAPRHRRPRDRGPYAWSDRASRDGWGAQQSNTSWPIMTSSTPGHDWVQATAPATRVWTPASTSAPRAQAPQRTAGPAAAIRPVARRGAVVVAIPQLTPYA